MHWAAFIELGLMLLLGGIVAWYILKPVKKDNDTNPK